jgi:hypothetical protein
VTGIKVKLQDCHETDVDQREAQFAFRSTDLQIWKEYFASRRESEFTDMDPVFSQHWSLAVRFPQQQCAIKKIYFLEAVEDKSGVDAESSEVNKKGILQPLCVINVDDEIFEKAEYFGTVVISPCELLAKANQVSINGTPYNGMDNNCQSWVKQFLCLISPQLLDDLNNKLSSSPVYSTRNIHRFLINAIQNAVANHTSYTAVNIVKLNECEEEFDQTNRDAQFAYQLRSIAADGDRTDPLLPGVMESWMLVIHFSRGKKTYLFGAWKDENGKLQPGRAENVDYQIFQSATHFGSTFITSPSDLLEKAKRVPSNGTTFNVTSNDSQSWLHEFLTLISPDLLSSLFEKESSIAATITER